MSGWGDRYGAWTCPTMVRQPVPEYRHRDGTAVMLAVECFARHMSSEGWQLQAGLEHGGCRLVGHGYPDEETDAVEILDRYAPAVVIVQDQREWDAEKPGCFDKRAEFRRTEALRERDDVFRVTIIKDAHHDPTYTARNHERMGIHAWLHYYHPSVVCRLAPWMRPQHMIRVHHTLNQQELPPFVPQSDRVGCLLSGAVGRFYYPLRSRLFWSDLPDTDKLSHPGYHAAGHATPGFLKILSRYKASICTTSIFGYSLRKIVEAVACGCVPITDLPDEDVIPEIDQWLERVPFDISSDAMGDVIRRVTAEYDEDYRRRGAQVALDHYNYRAQGLRLIDAIHDIRKGFNE